MNAMNATAADWTHIEPILDEAMHALDDTDRTAVLLRYFENKSLREVGQILGTSDDAAQKRVSRAVERLREFFGKRGMTVGASGLVVVISAHAVQAAPAGLVTTISSTTALAGTAIAATTTAIAAKTIVMTTLQKTLIAASVIAVGVGTTLLVQTPPARPAAFVSPPVDTTPVADEGRLGGPGNKLPDWRAGLATADTDEKTNQIQKIWCVDNLKQVGFAAHIWATNHGHVFPSNLFSLKSEISPRYLTCPADASRVEVTKWSEATPTNITYMLVSPNRRETRPNVIILRCPVHGHVALSDGRVLQGDYLQQRTVAADNSVQ
jgi:hypothetical protein